MKGFWHKKLIVISHSFLFQRSKLVQSEFQCKVEWLKTWQRNQLALYFFFKLSHSAWKEHSYQEILLCLTEFSVNWMETAISFIIYWNFSMFHKIFLWPQVKRWAIIPYKHDIYKLPDELPEGLRLRILGN